MQVIKSAPFWRNEAKPEQGFVCRINMRFETSEFPKTKKPTTAWKALSFVWVAGLAGADPDSGALRTIPLSHFVLRLLRFRKISNEAFGFS